MLRAYKTELDPNNAQRSQFVRYCGVARFVYNWALADRNARHLMSLVTSENEQRGRFNAIKDTQFPWIREVAYKVEESAFANCDLAFKNFFRRVKAKESKVGLPKFKSKKHGLGNFTLRARIIRIESRRIKLPVLGWIRLKESNYLPTDGVKILSATVSERARHWFVSLRVEEPDKPATSKCVGVIGVDVGIKSLASCSDGKVFENPKSLRRYEDRLAHIQRELCRRVKGSKNRGKTKAKVARLHYRIANIRSHALHEVTSYLTAKAKPQTIVIEDLNVMGMLQNRHLSKAIADASWRELRRQLEYKCAWRGIDLAVADRFYPSSKKCSECASVKPLLRLSERTFVCESCGAIIDRDLNAARNLAALVEPRNGRGLPVEGRLETPMKQEPSSDGTLHNSRRIGIGLP